MSLTPAHILLIVAAVLCVVELFQSRAANLLAWAVLIVIGVLLLL